MALRLHRTRAGTAVCLFDIDGTLIRRAGPHHRQALEAAVSKVVGFDSTTEGIPVQGMLDQDIVTHMLCRAGAAPAEATRHLPAILDEASRHYLAAHPRSLRAKVCPGVRSLLRRLTRRGAHLGLVTGNFTAIAWKKMELAGLREFFTFGAFSEMAATRAGLASLALAEARAAGFSGPGFLFGDHPNDIAAARATGLTAVAVATGVVPAVELASHSPDFLFTDFRTATMGSFFSS